jgi:hypothetical protein
MKGIKGELGSLPFTDLMQWIEMNRKSGVLFLSKGGSRGESGGGASKCFCFEGGKLLLASSNSEGGRFGDFLSKEGHINIVEIEKAVDVSRKGGISLITHLTSNRIIPEELMTVAIQQLAEDTIAEVLGWHEGSFEFVEKLPKLMAESPVRLHTSFVVFESVRKYDELSKRTETGGA